MSIDKRATSKFFNYNTVFLVCWFILMVNISYGQPGDESKQVIDSLLREAWANARIQPNESIGILQHIEDIQARQDTPHKTDVVSYYYGVFYKNLNRFDESETYFDKYESFHESRDHKGRVAAVNMAKANLFSDKGDLPKSMKAVSKSLSLYEALNDTAGVIIAGSKMGFLLTEVGRYDEALVYNRKSNKLSKLSQNIDQEVISYTNIALVYEKQQLYDSALVAYTKSYEIGETIDDSYGKVINRYNMANILDKMGRIDASVPYVMACMQLADSIDIPSLRAASRSLYAKLKLQQGDADGAAILLDSLAGNLNYELGLRDQKELYELLAEAYSKKGDFKKAFQHHQTYKALSDSILGKISRDKISELEIIYETEKQEQKIALLDIENKTSQALIAQKDRTILIIAGGLSLLTILSLVLYVLIRKYVRQKQALSKALSDKDVLLREIHHRVKNNLQIVSSLLSLQGRTIQDEIALRAINDGKSRVRSMALIHQNLYQRENLTGVNVKSYVTKLVEELMHTYQIDEEKVTVKLDVKALELDVDTLVPLGLIINELITNAFKYAFPEERTGTLWVSLQTTEGLLIVEVRDDGIGFNQENLRSDSFGQKLVRSLVKQLNGTMEIKSDDGTLARLEVRKFKSSDAA